MALSRPKPLVGVETTSEALKIEPTRDKVSRFEVRGQFDLSLLGLKVFAFRFEPQHVRQTFFYSNLVQSSFEIQTKRWVQRLSTRRRLKTLLLSQLRSPAQYWIYSLAEKSFRSPPLLIWNYEIGCHLWRKLFAWFREANFFWGFPHRQEPLTRLR